MFYTYDQTNSGGTYTGPAACVIVEADSAWQANAIARKHGVYFDGCQSGKDCSCCGDRWYRQGGLGTEEPKIDGKKPEDSKPPYGIARYKVPHFIIIKDEEPKDKVMTDDKRPKDNATTACDYPALMREAATALQGLEDRERPGRISDQTYDLIRGLREAAGDMKSDQRQSGMLDLTRREQLIMEEVCGGLAAAVWKLTPTCPSGTVDASDTWGEPPKPTTQEVGRDLLDVLTGLIDRLDIGSPEFGELYDKFHRRGKRWEM